VARRRQGPSARGGGGQWWWREWTYWRQRTAWRRCVWPRQPFRLLSGRFGAVRRPKSPAAVEPSPAASPVPLSRLRVRDWGSGHAVGYRPSSARHSPRGSAADGGLAGREPDQLRHCRRSMLARKPCTASRRSSTEQHQRQQHQRHLFIIRYGRSGSSSPQQCGCWRRRGYKR